MAQQRYLLVKNAYNMRLFWAFKHTIFLKLNNGIGSNQPHVQSSPVFPVYAFKNIIVNT